MVKVSQYNNAIIIRVGKQKFSIKVICGSAKELITVRGCEEPAILILPRRVVDLLERIYQQYEEIRKVSNTQSLDLSEFLYRAVLIASALLFGYVDAAVGEDRRFEIRKVLEEAAKIAEVKLLSKS